MKMKRNFLSVVRVTLPVVLAFIVLAAASGMFPSASPKPAWAGIHQGATTPYSNVIVVARSGGDFDSVQKALNSITDNSPTNRYLIWVAPGIYAERVTMKPYVDIEGAGELVTKITSLGGQWPQSATVTAANPAVNAEMRYLTVENTGGSYDATAIYISGASPSFLHLTATASGGSSDNHALYISGGSPTLRNVTAIASGGSLESYGMLSVNASPTVIDSVITALGGSLSSNAMWNFASSATVRNSKLSATGAGNNYAILNASYSGSHNLTIDNSTLVGSTNTIYSAFGRYVTQVGASKLEGGPVRGDNNNIITCAGVYDENYIFFPNICP